MTIRDYVNQTTAGVDRISEIEGEELLNVSEHEGRPEYQDEYRYVNVGPDKLRWLLERETDPDEIEALRLAERWMASRVRGGTRAGFVDRGDERTAIDGGSIQELAEAVDPVEHVGSLGELVADGVTFDDGCGIIDVEALLALDVEGNDG